jgi:putative phosphoesterase
MRIIHTVATTVVLLGDTHLPRFGRHLPGPLITGLQAAELILHVGDITQRFVLDLLSEFAPVTAVAGNNDGPELTEHLGLTQVVTVERLRLGMTHGHSGPGRTTPDRARRKFATVEPAVDAICFGHSHQPKVERHGDRWLLNPGSPTDRRRQPTFSYLRLEIEGRQLTPTLVTYERWR